VKTVLRAAYLATMTGAVMEAGEVLFERGWITEVGRGLAAKHPFARVVELGDAVLLPGLVNAHTHLELTSLRQLPRPRSFVDWILELRRGAEAGWGPEFLEASVEMGWRECLSCGVTCVGDVTTGPGISRPVLHRSPLRGVSFGEVLGMAGRIGQMEGRIAAAADRSFERDGLRAGIEPHAPYSLDLVGFERCLAEARRLGLPLATHLAETMEEADFLAKHTGDFMRLWDAIGGWDDEVTRDAGGPIRALGRRGYLDYPTVLAHVNYVDDAEMEMLARGRASVVYCPRTHAYFGHRPHRFSEMLERGINVAVGTDSAASSPDLNLVEELRVVHRLRPEMSVEEVWGMGTWRGAQALGMEGEVGRIARGMRADFCVIPVKSGEPLREVLERGVGIRDVWIGGQKVPHGQTRMSTAPE
jgi:cytosine/adenosine deaminase-related metal-dependent hydrolase